MGSLLDATPTESQSLARQFGEEINDGIENRRSELRRVGRVVDLRDVPTPKKTNPWEQPVAVPFACIGISNVRTAARRAGQESTKFDPSEDRYAGSSTVKTGNARLDFLRSLWDLAT